MGLPREAFQLLNQAQGEDMKITEFAEMVTNREGGAESMSIAQVKEVLRIANDLTKGLLYVVIKWL